MFNRLRQIFIDTFNLLILPFNKWYSKISSFIKRQMNNLIITFVLFNIFNLLWNWLSTFFLVMLKYIATKFTGRQSSVPEIAFVQILRPKHDTKKIILLEIWSFIKPVLQGWAVRRF